MCGQSLAPSLGTLCTEATIGMLLGGIQTDEFPQHLPKCFVISGGLPQRLQLCMMLRGQTAAPLRPNSIQIYLTALRLASLRQYSRDTTPEFLGLGRMLRYGFWSSSVPWPGSFVRICFADIANYTSACTLGCLRGAAGINSAATTHSSTLLDFADAAAVFWGAASPAAGS